MAKYFIYPTEGRETSASVDSGSIPDSGGSYTSNSGKVTNDERLVDGNLGAAANFTAQHATIRVDKGSGSIDKIDSIAYYLPQPMMVDLEYIQIAHLIILLLQKERPLTLLPLDGMLMLI